MNIQQIRVGGPLIGDKPHSYETDIPSWDKFEPIITPEIVTVVKNNNANGQKHQQAMKQRFILLPHERFISVLAYKTGTQIANLVPVMKKMKSSSSNDDDDATDATDHDNNVIIECVCLAKFPRKPSETSVRDIVDQMDIDDSGSDDDDDNDDNDNDDEDENADDNATAILADDDFVVLAGCRDGTIREFSLARLGTGAHDGTYLDCGPYKVPGPCYRPRRIIRVSTTTNSQQQQQQQQSDPIMHITAPALSIASSSSSSELEAAALIYVVVRTKVAEVVNNNNKETSKKMKEKMINVSLFRLVVDSFDGTTTDVSLTHKKKNKKTKQQQKQNDDDDDNKEQHSSSIPTKTRLDQIKCRVGCDKLGNFLNTTPFRLLSSVSSKKTSSSSGVKGGGGGGQSVFVVLARANAINVYYEQIIISSSSSSSSFMMMMPRYSPITFPVPTSNPLTSIAISLNGCDISSGHYRGEIKVMNNVLSEVERYHHHYQQQQPQNSKSGGGNSGNGSAYAPSSSFDPKSSYIASTVHWHSHPVNTITYDPMSSPHDPLLYSGGEESVLVTWQISKGKNRPADVLPRLALGGIIHIVVANSSPFFDVGTTTTTPANGILVYCADNTLQLFQSHNKGKLWKIQGINGGGGGGGTTTTTTTTTTGGQPRFEFEKGMTRIEVDPRADDSDSNPNLVVTGAPGAQGYIQWYDPQRQRLVESLEVAPYNRISRLEHDDDPLPSPTITKHVFSSSSKDGNGGTTLVTLDTTPTENKSIGAHDKETNYGVVTTIRFWSLNTNNNTSPSQQQQQQRGGASASTSSTAPYELSAAMTYPHGPKNRVTALGLSKDGTMACTVSNDEKAFRLWHKVVVVQDDDDDDDGDDGENGGGSHHRAPAWTCRFKVTIPAGFSNLPTSRDGVSFSDDGSIMAICFGNNVTLWDTTKEARYLTSLRHLDSSERIIDSIQFVSPGLVNDFLLIQSKSGVSLQSPFGCRGSAVNGWKWAVPPPPSVGGGSNHRKEEDASSAVTVTDATIVDNHAAVSISVFNATTGQSRLIFIDAATGKPSSLTTSSSGVEESSAASLSGIETRLSSVCSVGKYELQSNWGNTSSNNNNNNKKKKKSSSSSPPLKLYSLTAKGDLVCFRGTDSDDNDMASRSTTTNNAWGDVSSRRSGPTLDIGDAARKRVRRSNVSPIAVSAEAHHPPTKKMAVEVFGLVYADQDVNSGGAPATADLPNLSSNFVFAFVGRSLSRNRNGA